MGVDHRGAHILFRFSHILWVALLMIQDVAPYPVNVGLFDTNAVMLEADFLTYLIKQPGFDIHNSSQSYFAYRFFKNVLLPGNSMDRRTMKVLTLMLGVLVLLLSHNSLA